MWITHSDWTRKQETVESPTLTLCNLQKKTEKLLCCCSVSFLEGIGIYIYICFQICHLPLAISDLN